MLGTTGSSLERVVLHETLTIIESIIQRLGYETNEISILLPRRPPRGGFTPEIDAYERHAHSCREPKARSDSKYTAVRLEQMK
jgi:hypothetical protein